MKKYLTTLSGVLLATCAIQQAVSAEAPASAPAAAKITYPADLLGGLKLWNLALPTNPEGKQFPTQHILHPDLQTFSNEYFKLNDSKTAVVFTSLFGGSTTSGGTAFARSELRELNADGSLAKWDCEKSARSMTVRQRITKTPTAKPEMSIGQIHDAKNDNLEVFYTGPSFSANGVSDKGYISAKFNSEGSKGQVYLDKEHTVGDMMVVNITTKDGVMTVNYKNERTGKTATASAPFKNVIGGCFFKAGNYHQACSKTNIYGGTNESCAKKKYSADQWEQDPKGTSSMEIYALSIDY